MLDLKIAVMLLLVSGVAGMVGYVDVVTHKIVFTDVYKIKVVDDFLYQLEVRKLTSDHSIDESVIAGNKVAERPQTEPPKYIEEYDVISANKLEEDSTITSKKDVEDRVTKSFRFAIKEGIITKEHLKKISPKIDAFVENVVMHFSDFKFYVPEDYEYESPACIFFLDVKNLKFYVFKDLVYKGKPM